MSQNIKKRKKYEGSVTVKQKLAGRRMRENVGESVIVNVD